MQNNRAQLLVDRPVMAPVPPGSTDRGPGPGCMIYRAPLLNVATVGCNRGQCLMDLGNGNDSLPSKDQDRPQDKKAFKQEAPGTLESGGVRAVDDNWLTELSSAVSSMSSTPPSLQDLCSLSTSCSSSGVAAKKRVPRKSTAKSTIPDSSASGDFDVLVMKLWRQHLSKTGKVDWLKLQLLEGMDGQSRYWRCHR